MYLKSKIYFMKCYCKKKKSTLLNNEFFFNSIVEKMRLQINTFTVFLSFSLFFFFLNMFVFRSNVDG